MKSPDFKKLAKDMKQRCWKGYEPVPGKKAYSDGSCRPIAGKSKTSSIDYRGTKFPGYNQPIPSNKPEKKMMVLAKKGDQVKLIHFGQKGFKHNYSPEAKKSYLARSAGIRGKDGTLTKDDKFSANYWARKVLWPKGPVEREKQSSINLDFVRFFVRSLGPSVDALFDELSSLR